MIKTNISKTAFTTIACLMLMTGVVNADTKVKSRQTSGGQTMENTSYIKGKRQRTEMNNGQMVNSSAVRFASQHSNHAASASVHDSTLR